jgi:hypothetical protein
MKTVAILLVLIVSISHLALAEEAKPAYGFKDAKNLLVEGYEFSFSKAGADRDQWRMGYFNFRWHGAKAIRLWGFGFEKDGSLRVRFENFSKMKGDSWQEVPVGYCGTGAEMFALEPNREYVLQIPLWPYEKSGDKGVVKIDGENISVVSDPFDVEILKWNR